jgi:hypothetical protein
MTQLPTQSALDLGWLEEAIRAMWPRVRSAAVGDRTRSVWPGVRAHEFRRSGQGCCTRP